MNPLQRLKHWFSPTPSCLDCPSAWRVEPDPMDELHALADQVFARLDVGPPYTITYAGIPAPYIQMQLEMECGFPPGFRFWPSDKAASALAAWRDGAA